MNEKIQVERVESHVRRIATSPRHGVANADAHSAAAEWIANQLEASGCEIQFQEFAIPGQDSPRTGRNVIGLMAPRSCVGPALLIGAHYDSVPGSPGADDNASGVAAMLECATVLGDMSPRQPMMFVAFDAEEKQPPVEGLHGSTWLVEQLDAGELRFQSQTDEALRVAAAVILECIGYSSPPGTQRFPAGFQLLFPRAFDVAGRSGLAGDSVAVLSNRLSRPLARRFEQAAVKVELPVLPVELPGWMRVPYNLRRSDHAPFWDSGVPAIMVGDTANFRNPNYHTPSDTPDTIGYRMITKVVEALIEMASD